MRSIGAIVIFGSVLFVLASIGLTAKAIADLANPLSSISTTANGDPSTSSMVSSGTITSSSTAAATISADDGSTKTFSSIYSTITAANTTTTSSSYYSKESKSTSAGASVITTYTPAASFSGTSNNQNDDNTGSGSNEGGSNESGSIENGGEVNDSLGGENQGEGTRVANVNTNDNDEGDWSQPYDQEDDQDNVTNLNLQRPTYISVAEPDTIAEQIAPPIPIEDAYSQPTLYPIITEVDLISPLEVPYEPIRSTIDQLENLVVLSKRLVLQEGSNSSTNDGSFKQNLIILLILFVFQETLLVLFLILSFTFLWRFNTLDFNAEYQIILSRQSIHDWAQKSEEALLAAKKRTSHIRSFFITFICIGILLLGVFTVSFVLLSIWFTVNDGLTIATIASDTMTIVFLILVCVSLFFDYRKSIVEEEHAVKFEENRQHYQSQFNPTGRAASIISSIGSFSSFSTPPGWHRIRSSIRRGKKSEVDREITEKMDRNMEDEMMEREGQIRYFEPRQHFIPPSLPPTMESIPTPIITPSLRPPMERDLTPPHIIQDESETQQARYVGRPLRRITPLENISTHQNVYTNHPLSSPIGTPPPIPGMVETEARYPSHMISSLPSSSSSHRERFDADELYARRAEVEEEQEEYVRSLSDHSRTRSIKHYNNQRRYEQDHPRDMPDLPRSPIPESPSSTYSDVLLSPGTLCVAVPNSKGGTTMMPVAVGQSFQQVL